MDFVQNPTLENISREVDALWGARVTQIKKNNKELQPLVYAAWKLLFAGHRGRPKSGEESFSGWLIERKIPRRTGYKILNREQEARGERIVPVGTITVTEEDEELDIDDAQEGTTTAQTGPEAASVGSGDALASPSVKASDVPIHKPAPVNLKPTKTPEWFKTRRAELEKKLRSDVGEKEAAKIIDRCVVDYLERNGDAFPAKKSAASDHTALRKILQSATLQEAS